ncbi:MAG TPA: nucleotidyltransferase domain-containing protein [Sedimentisphaerales bacterium]|nr:nucleotidyltransferase domain-containing protein [Sedimentisphaerales bacterium]
MDLHTQIKGELDRIEREKGICIVYACESGSRAWGFESSDSDYDVRFLYLHPTEWYLRVVPGSDVIERPIDGLLDVSGWDLRKALQLLRKSNPPLLEWLQSPIVYRRRSSVVARIRDLLPQYYQPVACHYHYLHMAQGNYRDYLQGDVVWLKKYLYVLRPVLACLWIERGYGVVPIEFQALVERVLDDGDVKAAVRGLIRSKKSGEELDRDPHIPMISSFLKRELDRLSHVQGPSPERPSSVGLDHVFRECLIEVYGDRIQPMEPSAWGGC